MARKELGYGHAEEWLYRFRKIQQTKYAMNEVFEEEGAIKEAFSSIGQDQVFRFWKELNLKEKRIPAPIPEGNIH